MRKGCALQRGFFFYPFLLDVGGFRIFLMQGITGMIRATSCFIIFSNSIASQSKNLKKYIQEDLRVVI